MKVVEDSWSNRRKEVAWVAKRTCIEYWVHSLPHPVPCLFNHNVLLFVIINLYETIYRNVRDTRKYVSFRGKAFRVSSAAVSVDVIIKAGVADAAAKKVARVRSNSVRGNVRKTTGRNIRQSSDAQGKPIIRLPIFRKIRSTRARLKEASGRWNFSGVLGSVSCTQPARLRREGERECFIVLSNFRE